MEFDQIIKSITSGQYVRVSQHYAVSNTQYNFMLGMVFKYDNIWKVNVKFGTKITGTAFEESVIDGYITDLQCWEKITPLKKIIYTEHQAGSFEDMVQICVLCGLVICDYTGAWASSDGSAPCGWTPGPLFIGGKNPTVFLTSKPTLNYGSLNNEEDMYYRKTQPCVELKKSK